LSQFGSATFPSLLDADPSAPLRAAKTDALIAKNRAAAPPGVEQLREKPRLSIAELNQIDLDELRERYFADDRDVRPPFVKALDIIDLPRNTVANIAFGKPTVAGSAASIGGMAAGGAGIGALVGGPPGALAGGLIGGGIGAAAQVAAGAVRLLTPDSARDAITDTARTGAFGQPSVSVGDALKQMGVTNRVVRAVGGFVGDVAIDPLTYVGPAGWGAQAGRQAISGTGRKVLERSIRQAAEGGIDTVADQTAKRLILAAGYQPGQKVDDLSKAVLGDFSKSKIEMAFRPLGGERSSTGGIFTRFAEKSRHDGNLAEHEPILAVRSFLAQYGRGRAGTNIRIGKATKEGVGSEVLHVPFGGKLFPEMTFQVGAFTGEANRAVRQYQIAKSRSVAAGLASPEALEAFRSINEPLERARAIQAELGAEQKAATDRINELASAVEDGDPAAQTETAKLRMAVADSRRAKMVELLGDPKQGIEGLLPSLRRQLENNPIFKLAPSRQNVDEILRLGELRNEAYAMAKVAEAQSVHWDRAIKAKGAGAAEIEDQVRVKGETPDRVIKLQGESRTPAGLGAYFDSDEMGNIIINADDKVQAQVFEKIRPILDRIEELEPIVDKANQDGLGLASLGLPGGAQPLFNADEVADAPAVRTAADELAELRIQLWNETEPLRREKMIPDYAPREPLSPELQPTKLKKLKPYKEPKPTSKAAMLKGVKEKYPEALAKNLPPGSKRMIEMPSEAERMMFLAEQAGDDHGRLMAHLMRMETDQKLDAFWTGGGVQSVKAETLNVGDEFMIGPNKARVVDDADGIVIEVAFKEGEDIPMGGDEVLEAPIRTETFRLAEGDDVPYNASSMVEAEVPAAPPPPAPPPVAPATPTFPNNRTMQTIDEFKERLRVRGKEALPKSQLDLWKMADDAEVPGIDKLQNTPSQAEMLSKSFQAEADAIKVLHDSIGGTLDAHRSPEFSHLIGVIQQALGTDDDFIPHSLIGSMRTAMSGLTRDNRPVLNTLESMDRSHRALFGARGGHLAGVIRHFKRKLGTDTFMDAERVATEWSKRVDDVATKANVPSGLIDDARRLALLYTHEAAAKAAGLDSPLAMKLVNDANDLVDSGEMEALQSILKAMKGAGVDTEALAAGMRIVGDEAADLIKNAGNESIRDGLLEMLVPGYVPHVTTRDTRVALGAKKQLPNFQKGGMSAAYSRAGTTEQFQKPTTTDLYIFEDPRNPGKFIQFMEMDRWAAKMTDEQINGLRSFSPDLAKRAEEMRDKVDLYERLPNPPPPVRAGVFTANKLQREGKFGALSVGHGAFFEESLPHVLASRMGAQSRAVARQQLAELVSANSLRIDPNLLTTESGQAGSRTLPNGMIVETTPKGQTIVRARGRSWRQLNSDVFGLRDNPIIDSIDEKAFGYLLPEELAEAIEDTAKVWSPENASELLDGIERATSIMRSITLLHPSWTISNIIGNITNSAAAGVPTKKLLAYLPTALKVRMSRGRAGMLESLKSTVAGQNLSGPDLERLFTEHDMFGDHIPGMVMAEGIKRGFNDVPSRIREQGIPAQYAYHLAKIKGASGMGGKGLRSLGGGLDMGYDAMNRRIFGPWVRANAMLEDAFRGAAMLAVMDDGSDILAATDKVRRGLFSYHDLTRFEERWMRNIFPFYTWMRNNLAFQVHNLMQRPSYLAAVPRAMDAIEEMLAGEAQVPHDARPTWMNSALAMQIGSDPKSRFAIVLGNTIPQVEVLQLMQGLVGAEGAADVARYFTGNLNWGLTAGPQIGSRTQFFSGREIGVAGGGDVSIGQFALDHLRPVAEYGPGGKVWKAGERSIAQGLGRAVLGGRLQAFDEDRIKTSKASEFRQEIETHRRGIRKDEREGRPSTEARAALMRTYAAMIEQGFDEDVPKYARDQIKMMEQTNGQ
jgi:hypothetical protein